MGAKHNISKGRFYPMLRLLEIVNDSLNIIGSRVNCVWYPRDHPEITNCDIVSKMFKCEMLKKRIICDNLVSFLDTGDVFSRLPVPWDFIAKKSEKFLMYWKVCRKMVSTQMPFRIGLKKISHSFPLCFIC